ncbi:MAG: alpha/beta fold hydrolase [Burkholderiales bacterium]|jgi:pimeloyl-ACP methyl ester carboxylesterase|nr:alpha/beta fold hydrolase [Burkholderiales bacterium]
MLARALVVALAVELAGLLWLGTGLARTAGVGVALAAAVAVALGWRFVFVALTYLVAGLTPRRNQGVARAGPLAFAAGFTLEWAAFGVLFAVIQPFARWTMGSPERAFGPQDGAPVVLVHGYMCNRGFWWRIARRLADAGYRVHTIDLEPTFGGIDGFARQLEARLAEVRLAAGDRPIALVGHSMGGLVIRAWRRDHGDAGVAAVVTLGSPHHGTSLAWLGLGDNARQMRPQSDWLAALASAEPRSAKAVLVSIYSGTDNFVSPRASARLAWATNVPVAAVGHLAMAFSPEVQARLADALDRSGSVCARAAAAGAPL